MPAVKKDVFDTTMSFNSIFLCFYVLDIAGFRPPPIFDLQLLTGKFRPFILSVMTTDILEVAVPSSFVHSVYLLFTWSTPHPPASSAAISPTASREVIFSFYSFSGYLPFFNMRM